MVIEWFKVDESGDNAKALGIRYIKKIK